MDGIPVTALIGILVIGFLSFALALKPRDRAWAAEWRRAAQVPSKRCSR